MIEHQEDAETQRETEHEQEGEARTDGGNPEGDGSDESPEH